MPRLKVFIDLCSGLGGASEAFMNSPDWYVIRIENNPLLEDIPGSKLLDILEWPTWIDSLEKEIERMTLEVVWASPPCTDFSRAYSAPAPRAERAGDSFEPDMSIMLACLAIIDRLKPRFYVIENVQGALGAFTPHLGPLRQRVGPFYLWGRFPYIPIPPYWSHCKYENDASSQDPLRANRRALVPLVVSKALMNSISSHTTLFDY